MTKRKSAGLAIMMAFPAFAAASGYHFGSQSASNQGVANAGPAAVFDASTIFFNPAGLSRLKGNQLSVVGNIVVPKTEFTDSGTTINIPGTAVNRPVTGTTGEFAETTFVPHLYYSNQLSDTVTFGVGAFVPFGSNTQYDETWSGRYNVVETELKTLAINPSLSWKLNERLSLGAGVSAQYMKGKIFRHVNFGGAGISAVNRAPGLTDAQRQAGTGALLGMYGNLAYDGTARVEGDDWGFGFNLGLLWNLTDSTRMGLAYRSAIRHRLQGDAEWGRANVQSEIAARLTAAGFSTAAANAIAAGAQSGIDTTYVNSGATVKVDTPESFSINGYTELTPQWALMADMTWTRHSRFKQLRIDFASGVQDSVTVEDWENTTRWSLGALYKASDKLTLKSGVAIDNSPVNDQNRTASIPDNRRTWVSLGLGYAFSPKSTFDLAYTYIHVKDSTIRHTDNGGGEACACSYATLRGDYDISSHLIGVQYSLNF